MNQSSSKTDGRRRRYVPVDVNVAFGRFGTRLHDRWGMEGLCAWLLLLAAAKREPNQGTFTFTSEVEAWTKLGAEATLFTFEEFVRFCGHNKQTRKRVVGRVKHVEITGWRDWNNEWEREQDSLRKSRKRATIAPDIARTFPGSSPDIVRTEAEAEYEGETAVRDTVTAAFAGLPISVEKGLELERMLPFLHDRDEGSLGVLQAASRPVSFAAVCRVRESVCGSRKRVGVGYAVNALKSEASAA